MHLLQIQEAVNDLGTAVAETTVQTEKLRRISIQKSYQLKKIQKLNEELSLKNSFPVLVFLNDSNRPEEIIE